MTADRLTIRGGGSDRIWAELTELTQFAALLDQAAGLVLTVITRAARVMLDPAVLSAGLLDPPGGLAVAARVTSTVAAGGVTELGLQWLASTVRAAVRSYQAVDELVAQARPVAEAVVQLSPAIRSARPGPTWFESIVTADPALAAVAVHALSVSPAIGVVLPVPALAGLLAASFHDGQPVVTPRTDQPTTDDVGPPRTVTGLLTALALRDADDDGGGLIDIRILGSPAGRRRAIVDITGTTIWNIDPWRRTPQASDLGTNLRTLANQASVQSRGVLAAMRAAGLRSDDQIMLVGHSQGGMVAARLATELAVSGEFTVTHLVTAGSPIALARVPRSVSVLALENRGDLVPQLDGAGNPARSNWLTVGSADGGSTVLEEHSMRAYLGIAAEIDASTDPALARWRAGAAGFFTAASVRTQVWQIRRSP